MVPVWGEHLLDSLYDYGMMDDNVWWMKDV